MNKKEKFIQKAQYLHSDKNYDYSKVVYVDNRTKVEIICHKCGKSFFQRPNDHNSSRHPQNCPCYDKTKKSNIEEFIKKAIKVHGDKFNYDKSVYVNCKDKMKIYCNEHKQFFWMNANNHLQGQGCSCGRNEKISNNNKKHNQESFIKKSNEIHGDKFDYSLVEYIDIKKIIKIRCIKHNYVFEQTPDSHLRSVHCCPICLRNFQSNEMTDNSYALKTKTTLEEFIYKANKIHKDKYKYDKVVYINNDEKIKIYCKKCSQYFLQRPRIHINAKSGCPNCIKSKGENVIENILISNNIKFKKQKTFKDCKLKKFLKFDFYIIDFNILCEYNGKQHYEYIPFFHKKEKEFELRQLRDNLKREYAKKNNIKLIEIPYWEHENIESILKKELSI